MSKYMLLVCILLLTTAVISAAPSTCGRHGDPCETSAQCCNNIACNKYARRCQVQITVEELMAQREKILGRKGKDY